MAEKIATPEQLKKAYYIGVKLAELDDAGKDDERREVRKEWEALRDEFPFHTEARMKMINAHWDGYCS